MNEKLEKFSKLHKNWNGYGAEPFDIKYLESVDEFLKYLDEEPEIFPLPEGEVQLEHQGANYYFEFVLRKDHTMEFYGMYKEKDLPTTIYAKWSAPEINNRLKNTKAYIAREDLLFKAEQELEGKSEMTETSLQCPICGSKIKGLNTLQALSGRLVLECECGYCNRRGIA